MEHMSQNVGKRMKVGPMSLEAVEELDTSRFEGWMLRCSSCKPWGCSGFWLSWGLGGFILLTRVFSHVVLHNWCSVSQAVRALSRRVYWGCRWAVLEVSTSSRGNSSGNYI
jgi:hypothetical protein